MHCIEHLGLGKPVKPVFSHENRHSLTRNGCDTNIYIVNSKILAFTKSLITVT